MRLRRRIVQIGAPPPWDAAWGSAVPVVRADRLLAPCFMVGGVLGYLPGLALGQASEPVLVGVDLALTLAALALLTRRPRGQLRVRSLAGALPVVDLVGGRPLARAAAWLVAGLALGLVTLGAPGAAAGFVAVIALVRRRRLLRRLEAATGGTVLRAARRPPRGTVRHSGLYLLPGAAPEPVDSATADPPVARPATPYARLAP